MKKGNPQVGCSKSSDIPPFFHSQTHLLMSCVSLSYPSSKGRFVRSDSKRSEDLRSSYFVGTYEDLYSEGLYEDSYLEDSNFLSDE